MRAGGREHRRRLAIAVVTVALALAGCGVSSQQHARVIPNNVLPAGLRPPATTTTTTTSFP